MNNNPNKGTSGASISAQGSRIIPIAKQAPLPEEQQRSLRCLVGLMIPASSRYGIPGADDELIFKDLLASLGTLSSQIGQCVDRLDVLAGGSFATSSPAEQLKAGELLKNERMPSLMPLTSLVAQCYYRDDRVMRSLEMEARPPFPKGFELENGDWSLLDPVRSRPPLYRNPP